MYITVGGFEQMCLTHPNVKIKGAPLGEGSWRGVYAEAAIFVAPDQEATLDSFLPFLIELKTNGHRGYKGGKYFYNNDTRLNFEAEESYNTNGKFLNNLLQEKDNEEFKALCTKYFE